MSCSVTCMYAHWVWCTAVHVLHAPNESRMPLSTMLGSTGRCQIWIRSTTVDIGRWSKWYTSLIRHLLSVFLRLLYVYCDVCCSYHCSVTVLNLRNLLAISVTLSNCWSNPIQYPKHCCQCRGCDVKPAASCLLWFICPYQCSWLPGKTRLQCDPLCVQWDVKLNSVSQSKVVSVSTIFLSQVVCSHPGGPLKSSSTDSKNICFVSALPACTSSVLKQWEMSWLSGRGAWSVSVIHL